MLIRNAWYVAAWADEVSEQVLARRICNDPIVVFRDKSGTIAALEDRCCHRAAPLRFGRVVQQGLQCGYHGLVFDRTGKCVHIPSQDRIPSRARVRSYPVAEKDQLIWIWMGDPDKADVTKIIDYPYHNDHANWPHKHDMIHTKANYMLLVDNLMDLTHIGYLHEKTIGAMDVSQAAAHAKAKMNMTPNDRGFTFIRWLLESVPPPTYAKAVSFKGRIDRWQEFQYLAPNNVLQWSGALDVGRGAYENRDQDGAFSIRLFHSLTPETENTCFYFWSGANGYRQDDSTATEDLFRELRNTFAEDKVLVEGQQVRLDERETGLIEIASDAARVHMRRTVQRILADEARATSAVPGLKAIEPG